MEFILATSAVLDGNMSFQWGEESEVNENRKNFLEKHTLKLEDCVFMDLEHGDEVAIVGDSDKGKVLTADALITNTPGVTLFLMTADCLPLALHDPEKNVIALVHLGWKSSDLGLAAKTVEAMTRELGSDPKTIKASIGPGIHKESYLVENPSQKDNPKWAPFLEETMGFTGDVERGKSKQSGLLFRAEDARKSSRTRTLTKVDPVVNFGEAHSAPTKAGIAKIYNRVDLVGFNLEALTNAGIRNENISISPEDTAISPSYFSHFCSVRTNKPEGRFATVAVMQ